MIDDNELKKIEDRCNAAHVGPWRFLPGKKLKRPTLVSLRTNECLLYSTRFDVEVKECVEAHNASAEFIAHARDNVPKLVAEVKRQRDERTALFRLLTEQQYRLIAKAKEIAKLKAMCGVKP